MEKNIITAEEARRLADSSEVVKKRVYKCIKERALEGELDFIYNMGPNPSMVLINSLQGDLVSNGFNVSVIPPEDEFDGVGLYISWENRD